MPRFRPKSDERNDDVAGATRFAPASTLGTMLLGACAWVACSTPTPEPIPVAAQHAAYDAPIIEYLDGLGDDAIGQTLDGVRADPSAVLASEELLLADAVYLGRVPELPAEVHVHLVRSAGSIVAYLWVDTSGTPFPLPECDPGRVGFRARRVWGPIYTWRSAQPGDGVLISDCPAKAWIDSAGGSRGSGT